METLLRRCVEVRRPTAIDLSFGMVSGVSPGIYVLDGSPRGSREGAVYGMVFGILRNFGSNDLNGDMA